MATNYAKDYREGTVIRKLATLVDQLDIGCVVGFLEMIVQDSPVENSILRDAWRKLNKADCNE